MSAKAVSANVPQFPPLPEYRARGSEGNPPNAMSLGESVSSPTANVAIRPKVAGLTIPPIPV